MTDPVYASDPERVSDAAFLPADFAHLTVGNRGRLLDARRTPLRVTAVDPDRGEFEVEIEAFEDRGARWRLPVWEISRLQFEIGCRAAAQDLPARLTGAVARFDRPHDVPAEESARVDTVRRVLEHRRALRPRLARLAGLLPLERYVERREGDPRLSAELDRYLAELGLGDMDRELTRTLVSNPRSGEQVKGHAIVLAELGLHPFHGSVVRDPVLFDGGWSRRRRAEHLIVRMAFAQELWTTRFGDTLRLYRAAASDEPLRHRRDPSFVSWSLSERVADEHFAGGPTTVAAVKVRRDLPASRLVMSFLETAAFNAPYREAEVLVVGAPEGGAS